MKRRDFIKNVLGAGTMGMLGLSAKPMFAASPSFSDYKAMVCILWMAGMMPGILSFQKDHQENRLWQIS